MKIALVGTDGIPARYGGFETFVEQVVPHLVALGHEVLVVGSSVGRQETAPETPGLRVVNLPLRANGRAASAWWRLTDAEQEKLRDAWFDAPDLAAQQKIAAEIQKRALENVMFVPLGLQFAPTAFRSNLSGFAKSGSAVFWGVRKG